MHYFDDSHTNNQIIIKFVYNLILILILNTFFYIFIILDMYSLLISWNYSFFYEKIWWQISLQNSFLVLVV